jgi:hypothetical protein
MTKFRFICGMLAVTLFVSIGRETKAQNLVGFYVHHDRFGRGLTINEFIPFTSAEDLHWQGELMRGDIITMYDGQRVRSAAHVRQISARSAPGTWLRMDFITPNGERFWHWVMPGREASSPGEPTSMTTYRRGGGRPGGQGDSGIVLNNDRPGHVDGPGRPNVKSQGRPNGSSGPGRPR